MTLTEMIEHLYDLDRAELRRLAYEALLLSDGPDHISGGDAANARLSVGTVFPLTPEHPAFWVWEGPDRPAAEAQREQLRNSLDMRFGPRSQDAALTVLTRRTALRTSPGGAYRGPLTDTERAEAKAHGANPDEVDAILAEAEGWERGTPS